MLHLFCEDSRRNFNRRTKEKFMIYTISVRTDIPTYYWEWFSNRLSDGFCYVRNPYYPEKVSKYSLKPEDVDSFCFLSKNYERLLSPRAGEISFDDLVKTYPCSFLYTITPYGKDIEARVPSIDESIDMFVEMSRRSSKDQMTWFFDPLFFYKQYDEDYILSQFEYMARRLAPYTHNCSTGFINLYEKTKRNLPEAILPDPSVKFRILDKMTEIAEKTGLHLQMCGMTDYENPKILRTPCVTLSMLEEQTGIKFKDIKAKGDCIMCGKKIQTRDLGVYNSCYSHCKYCYACESPLAAAKLQKEYDKDSPILLDHIREDDIISEAKQISYRK